MDPDATSTRCNSVNFLIYAAHATSAFIIPIYAAELGASEAMIGLIGGVYGFAAFMASLAFGRAGDRFDRRSILRIGFVLAVVGFLAQLVAFTPETLMMARFLAGFSFGAIPPTLAAYVYEIRRPLGRFASFNALGFLFGSLAIALLGVGSFALGAGAGTAVLSALFVTSAGLAVSGLLLVGRLPSMRMGYKVSLFPLHLIKRNLHVYVPILLRHIGAHSVWIIFPLYIIQIGGDIAMVGWVHVINMLTQIAVLRSIERHPKLGRGGVMLGIGLLLSSFTIVSFGLVENAYQLLPLQIPLGVSFACLYLGSLKTVMESTHERGTASGLLNGSFMLSQVIGPIAGGLVAEALGFRALFYAAGAVGLLAFAFFALWRPSMPGAPTELGAREPVVLGP